MTRYHVRIDDPNQHLVHVRLNLPAGPARRRLFLPRWSPGSYLIRDYARQLTPLEARDPRGRRLTIVKVGTSEWEIEGAAAGARIDYQVYAHERSVRTSHVTHLHAFLHGPALFLYTDATRRRPCKVRLDLPTGWRASCALEQRGDWFVADDYDQLVDAPIECGRHTVVKFRAVDVPFTVALSGDTVPDSARLRRDFASIAKAQHELFGSFPFADYLAIVNFTAASRGGLEHATSMAVEWPRRRLTDSKDYADFMSLFSHELFHAWNVKAARPAAFTPYDYQRETPTRLLWWFEGVTDYYAVLLLLRAGVIDAADYLRRLGDTLQQVVGTPGRRALSVADSSFDAWIRLYKPDEDTANSSISYYRKGHLLGALIDIEIRARTDDRRSLDDVARRIVRSGARGLAESGVHEAIAKVTGGDPAPWLDPWVHGTEEIDVTAVLRQVGLTVASEPAAGAGLDAEFADASGRARLKSVVRGGAAATGGLSVGDEIVAVDGVAVDGDQLRKLLRTRGPGDAVEFSFLRDDLLCTHTVRLGAPAPKPTIVTAKTAIAPARARLKAWLGVEWEELATTAAAPSKPAVPTGSRSARSRTGRRTRSTTTARSA